MFNFTAWPEMVAWPYLMLSGWLPYRDIAIAHTPLLLVVLAFFYKIFGAGIIQLKMFTFALIGLNTIMLYWVLARLGDKKKAVFAALIYVPLVIYYQGFGLWFDLALVPFSLGLYYLLKKKNLFMSGVIFALGILTKQTFAYFLLPISHQIVKIGKNASHKIKKFILGGSIVFLVAFILLSITGILDDLYFWTVKFGVFYLPHASGQIQLPSFNQLISGFFPFLAVFWSLEFEILSFMLAGIMGVYPRWELFHFQPALPFLAIAIINVIFSRKNRFLTWIYLVLLLILLSRGIWRNLSSKTRFYESEVEKVVNLVRENNPKSMYVVNYWDNLYGLTGTIPATKPLIPYIPWYLEVKGAKENIIYDLKEKLPDVMVVNEKENLRWTELIEFVDRYYICQKVTSKLEVCTKNE